MFMVVWAPGPKRLVCIPEKVVQLSVHSLFVHLSILAYTNIYSSMKPSVQTNVNPSSLIYYLKTVRVTAFIFGMHVLKIQCYKN